MLSVYSNKIKARKILLDKCDVVNFGTVPGHIVDAFFGYGTFTYWNRFIVCNFVFLNGISYYQLLGLVRWKHFNPTQRKEMKDLLRYLEHPQSQAKYYSYNIHYGHGLVMFLNGDVKKYGERILK